MAGFLKVQSHVIWTKNTKKSYIQNTPAKMKYNTNTLTGCISTEPHQMDIRENRPNGKININNRTKTNDITI